LLVSADDDQLTVKVDRQKDGKSNIVAGRNDASVRPS
jgi:hypothetical protein